jgi:hypothetical protein
MKRYLVHAAYISAILLVGYVTPTSAEEPVVAPIEQVIEQPVNDTSEPVASDPEPTASDPEPFASGPSFDQKEQSSIVVKNIDSFRDRFFSVDRVNPYINDPLSPEEEELLDQSTHENDNWDSRVLGCNSLPTWEAYFECMWKPWKYGF